MFGPDWIVKIRKGDVLQSGSGDFRIVREVKHSHIRTGRGSPFDHIRTSVVFAIRTCSWTKRCYTVLNSTDLRQRGFRPTGVRMRLNTKIDAAIEAEINRAGAANLAKLHCCDVVGVG